MFSKIHFPLITVVVVLLLPLLSNAQAVLYEQNFEPGSGKLGDFVLSNLDQGIPADTNWSELADSAWVTRYIPENETYAAVATSRYNPEVEADDWLVTPGIQLGKASRLSWKAMSLNAARPDSYLVYISTSEQSANGCLLNFPIDSVIDEQSGQFAEHSIDLASLGYANQTVYAGFRLIGKTGDFLAIDDIKVADDSIQSLVSLTFVVNMSKYIADSNFRPSTDSVDIAGNFNNWDGSGHIMSLVPGTDSSIYSITIPGFWDTERLEFKFRINSSWNDTAAEFPYGAPNRLWIVENGKYTFTAYYNETGSVSGIPDASQSEVASVFPNPVSDVLTVVPTRGIDKMILYSMDGNSLAEFPCRGEKISMNVSDYPPGLYLLIFYSDKGMLGSSKIVIR